MIAQEKRTIAAILVNAHCILKHLYVSLGKSADDYQIQEEVFDIYQRYFDSEEILTIGKS